MWYIFGVITSQIRGSIVASISSSHAEVLGSIPGRRVFIPSDKCKDAQISIRADLSVSSARLAEVALLPHIKTRAREAIRWATFAELKTHIAARIYTAAER